MTNQLTPEQIKKYRELSYALENRAWYELSPQTTIQAAASAVPQLLDAYEEATRENALLMSDPDLPRFITAERQLSEAQQLLQAAVEVLDVAAKTLFDEVSAVSARPVWELEANIRSLLENLKAHTEGDPGSAFTNQDESG
jgi:hypothetical protein